MATTSTSMRSSLAGARLGSATTRTSNNRSRGNPTAPMGCAEVGSVGVADLCDVQMRAARVLAGRHERATTYVGMLNLHGTNNCCITQRNGGLGGWRWSASSPAPCPLRAANRRSSKPRRRHGAPGGHDADAVVQVVEEAAADRGTGTDFAGVPPRRQP